MQPHAIPQRAKTEEGKIGSVDAHFSTGGDGDAYRAEMLEGTWKGIFMSVVQLGL